MYVVDKSRVQPPTVARQPAGMTKVVIPTDCDGHGFGSVTHSSLLILASQIDQIRYLIHSQKRPILLEGLHIDSPSQSRMYFGDAWQAEHLTQVKGNCVSIRKKSMLRSVSLKRVRIVCYFLLH
ncbi:hypothetical protein TNCV_21871 [Trichonephila clavipes]|nr:hypothetical protein TNCV_21871 [Trichonephila clavipes]